LPAQEMPVPVDVQFTLFAKILSFDRNFDVREKTAVTIGILYQGTYRTSLHAKDDAVRALQTASISVSGKLVRFVEFDVAEGIDRLTPDMLGGIDVLYITPLTAVDIVSIAGLTRTRSIRSLTGVPEYVASGVAVGIGTRGERPEIVINLPAAKLEGSNYSSQLLKLARVIP